MEKKMCLNPWELQDFVGRLDQSIVSAEGDTVTIRATDGAIEWVYVEMVNLFCIGGDFFGALGGILS